MANNEREKKRHFTFRNQGDSEEYKYPGGGPETRYPDQQNRLLHGQKLLRDIEQIGPGLEEAVATQKAAGIESYLGLRIEFESFPDVEDVQRAFESLDLVRSGIELLNVREDQDRAVVFATVFLPDGKLHILENRIEHYLDEQRDSEQGRPRNQRLVDSIREIRTATLESLWTDDKALFPDDPQEVIWWEVWLPIGEERQAPIGRFREHAQAQGLEVVTGQIDFPERTVLLALGSVEQMRSSALIVNSIAELRLAKETAEFFDSLEVADQKDWIDDLKSRTNRNRLFPAEDVPYATILDTGINQNHPLIESFLDENDTHSVDPDWVRADEFGHGTEMAGLTLYGDLTPLLENNSEISVPFRIESVKILRFPGDNNATPEFHGFLTEEAIARVEVTGPERKRVFCTAVTAKDGRDRGRPSAWSAAIDGQISDAANLGGNPRLLAVSAGNVNDLNAWAEYPESNASDGIHDPGQAWNALTVGAFTDKSRIDGDYPPDLRPVASAGALSPFSTTSLPWSDVWPLKPDVVFEGGNAARDSISAVQVPSLDLLSCYFRFQDRLLTTSNATSAATALASNMAAKLMAEYSEAWPETIRGLIVHSAEWTPRMAQMHLPRDREPNKDDYKRLVRHVGFGVPDLDSALWSMENSVCLVSEDTLIPYQREGTKPPKIREMKFHALPWPKDALEQLRDTEVRMRVTLSYFIEPNPSSRGVKTKYAYQSHGLRFDVKRPEESIDGFRGRLNAAARAEERGNYGGGNDPNWLIGKQNRHKGSIHSDIWVGNAVDLASREMIGVYPVSGWWKLRPKLEMYDREIRYSLLVSILAPEVDVELYSEIATELGIEVEV